jgi:hypothetical protein
MNELQKDFAVLKEFGFNHALLCVHLYDEDTKAQVLHICGYENTPSEEDEKNLIEELSNDNELEMTHMVHGIDYVCMYVCLDDVLGMN